MTGRVAEFGTLRREGGMSGYPSQAESEHDIVENSHASTALSYADGIAKAYAIRGEDRHVVAVIGDGALTGGMAWEALNNIAIARDSRLVMVVNDNGRSYTPTIGGLANALTGLRTNPRYEQVLDVVKKRVNAVPAVGPGRLRRPPRGQEGPQGRASRRRACSRTSASSTSAPSTATTGPRWSRPSRRRRSSAAR